jgi:hypothetical protein
MTNVQTKHVLCSIALFPKSYRLRDKVEKYFPARKAKDNKIRRRENIVLFVSSVSLATVTLFFCLAGHILRVLAH